MTGLGDFLLGFALFHEAVLAIVRDGVIDAIGPRHATGLPRGQPP